MSMLEQASCFGEMTKGEVAMKCVDCIHERVCKAWKKELDSAEEAYSGEYYVTIYDRLLTNGEYFT